MRGKQSLLTKELLYDLRVEQRKYIDEIARKTGWGHGTIWRALQKFNVLSWKRRLTEDLLRQKYIVEKKSTREIGEETGWERHCVARKIKQFGIAENLLSICNSGEKNGRYGKPVSQETRRKIGEANSKWKRSDALKRKVALAMKRHWQDAEFKRKMLECSLKGEENSSWRGGNSFEPYSPDFNTMIKWKIKKRDNCTCQLCGKTEGEEMEKYGCKLAVHHIDYDKKNSSAENLITLCKVCNNKVNLNRQYWKAQFQDKLMKFHSGEQS